MIVMDDWGFNDVSWHDHTNTNMPFLDEFVKESALTIDTFYAYPLCSISRAALLTGRYPIRYGLQSFVIENGYPFGLSIFETTLAQDLKQNGYNTAMIGKWHLGFHRNDLTPLQRGFDHFRGSLSPMIHFYDYSYQVIGQENGYSGKDLYINDEQVDTKDTNGQYLTYWERDQFIDVLNTFHQDLNPFFMYVAMHASHSPHDAPSECLGFYDEEQCNAAANKWDPAGYYQCAERQIVQGQTSCADESLEDMITTLQDMDDGKVWDNTLIIWLSDNGAPVWDGDNSPLRGGKKFLYEGGVRTPSFVAGGYLNQERYGKIYGDGKGVFHITDWYVTILSMANIDIGQRKLDGKDQWNAIQNGIVSQELVSTNREFLYNAESKGCLNEMCGAYRYGEYKLIWISEDAEDSQPFWYDFYSQQSRFNVDGSLNDKYSDYLSCGPIPSNVQYKKEFDENNGAFVGSLACNDKPCLFNLAMDPCEYNDLSQRKEYENLYAFMYTMLKIWYNAQQITLTEYYENGIDERSDPVNFNGFWQPWIRNYDESDSYEDFEDVMKGYSLSKNLSEDITQSELYQIAMEYKMKWIEQKTMFESDVDDLENEIIGSNDEQISFEWRSEIIVAIVCGMLVSILVVIWWIKTYVDTYRQTHHNDGENMPLLK